MRKVENSNNEVDEVWGPIVIIINIRFIYKNYKIKNMVVPGGANHTGTDAI